MSRKLHERFIPEKSSLSYADFHNEVTKCEEGNSLNSNGKQKKKVICGRVSKDDELVKYMSSLPGYLEKGQKVGEGVLNVGVLDWGRLEQWRYGHKQVPHGSSGSSTSTSNISSSVSTDALSGNSTRGRSLSCYRERISRPSLQSHLIAPPMDDRSLADKHFGGSVGNCQNLIGSHSKFASQSKHVQADDLLSQNHPTSIMKGCNKKYLCPHIDTETEKLPNGRRYEAASCAKIVKSTQYVGMQKRLHNLQESNINTFEKAKLTKGKPVVVLMPRDISQNRHCGASSMCTSLGQKFGSPTRTSHSEKPKKPPHIYPNHDAPHSCFLPDVNKRSHSQPKGSASSSMDPEKIKTPASALPAPLPVKMGTSPCRSRKAEKRKHTIASSAIKPPQILEQKVTAEKSRSSSPFRRFSINLGFAGKGSGCKDVAHVPHQNSITDPKSCSENAICYTSTNVSGNIKPVNAGRSTTSPLRRLLDPLLKPKAANCRRYIELSQNDSVLIKKNCRSGNVKPSTFLPEKELDMDYRVDCTTTKTTDSSKEKKCVPSTFHALLRIAVKNGQPLFTFVVDNYSEILAATMKNITVTRKDECHSIYTFFTFREVKKKNGSWMNQTGKSKVPDYIHHAVAQMKVSESHCFDSTSQNCKDSSIAKVFVLFSVKLRQGNTQVTDYQPNDELAAIVVKAPKAINFVSQAHQNLCQNDSQDLVHVTAVLPSGVHSLPSDGGPSSLIERWKTGGACDCGGWDLGCKLQILANQNQSIRNSRTSKANQFELFLQGNDQEHRPSFSLSPFKPGIYSVAFDSSFSILQAFSTCIALVDGNISNENSTPRCSVEGKDPTETLMVQTEEPKDFVKLANNPASYVAYPPVSPVGRV